MRFKWALLLVLLAPAVWATPIVHLQAVTATEWNMELSALCDERFSDNQEFLAICKAQNLPSSVDVPSDSRLSKVLLREIQRQIGKISLDEMVDWRPMERKVALTRGEGTLINNFFSLSSASLPKLIMRFDLKQKHGQWETSYFLVTWK